MSPSTVSDEQLLAAFRLGELVGSATVLPRPLWSCPYTTKALVDIWYAGYEYARYVKAMNPYPDAPKDLP